MIPNSFTIRVYGLLIKESKVLLSKEHIRGENYIKLPGGGLEFGEGTIECLKREFMEELNLPITVKRHFYTTEAYFVSAFDPNVQVMSIYYIVDSEKCAELNIHDPKDESNLKAFGDQIVYWCPLPLLHLEDIKLPIDKIVLMKLERESSTY